jgi:hypothetical protein
MIRSDDSEDVLRGATIGVGAGAGAGVVGGLLEWVLRPRSSVSSGKSPHRVTTTVTVSEDVSGRRVVGPMLLGRF